MARGRQTLIDQAAERARQAGVATATALLEDGGWIPDITVAESERWPTDLIVMGTQGRYGSTPYCWGARKAPCANRPFRSF